MSSKKEIFIYGASYPDTIELLDSDPDINLRGIIDDKLFGKVDEVLGVKIVGTKNILYDLNSCLCIN
ncbi:MAG: hypothetical protein VYB42_08895, partial [Verrucomicrobiota bacterium]|nr:hypothetical protein [Verrucomicrobiota bacterium]